MDCPQLADKTRNAPEAAFLTFLPHQPSCILQMNGHAHSMHLPCFSALHPISPLLGSVWLGMHWLDLAGNTGEQLSGEQRPA